MDSWEFDDEDGDDGAASPAAAGEFDPFADEDASSDDGGNWDDSSDDEAEKLPKKGGGSAKLGAKQKSGRELARLKKDKERQERRKALKAERMSLARAAGRNFEADAASAADGPSWRVMQMDEDGRTVEHRRDPSDGGLYSLQSFTEVYGERAPELWQTAGSLMAEAEAAAAAPAPKPVDLRGSDDEDDLFGDDFDASDAAPASASAGTLDDALRHPLVTRQEFEVAADMTVRKFEQLIVSDNCERQILARTSQPPPTDAVAHSRCRSQLLSFWADGRRA